MSAQTIALFQQYDGFAIELDGVRTTINQEDTVEALADALAEFFPDIEVTFEEEC